MGDEAQATAPARRAVPLIRTRDEEELITLLRGFVDERKWGRITVFIENGKVRRFETTLTKLAEEPRGNGSGG